MVAQVSRSSKEDLTHYTSISEPMCSQLGDQPRSVHLSGDVLMLGMPGRMQHCIQWPATAGRPLFKPCRRIIRTVQHVSRLTQRWHCLPEILAWHVLPRCMHLGHALAAMLSQELAIIGHAETRQGLGNADICNSRSCIARPSRVLPSSWLAASLGLELSKRAYI